MRMLIPYLLAFGLVLCFMDAIYWDDWTLFNVDENVILETFKDAGAIFNWSGYFHVAMLKVGPPLYRLMVLVFGYLCGVLLWQLLRTFRESTSEERFWIALLFLVLPFNPARFALINAPYILCLFLFFLAWYLFIFKRGLFFKCLTLTLFLLSFNTNSLLVFYLLPMMHAAWLNSEQKWKSVIRFGTTNVLFVIAPIFFFWFKTQFYPPHGLYAGYNGISFKLLYLALLPLPVIVLGFYLARRHFKGEWQTNRWFLFVISGLFTLWLAALPYLVTGKLPTFTDWDSRHQLLLPLGGALLLVGAGLFFGSVVRFCRIASIVSVIFCAYFMATLALDWRKQKEVIKLFAQSQDVKAASTIVVVDTSTRHNAFGRTNSFYEYNGWLKKSFGDETRFTVNYFDVQSLTLMELPNIYRQYATARYNAGNYIWSRPDLIVTIRSSGRSLMWGNEFIQVTTEKINTLNQKRLILTCP